MYLANKPRDQKSEHNSVVGLVVTVRHANVTALPQLAFPVLQSPRSRADIEQDHLRVALDEPIAVDDLFQSDETA
jgi:hypothetical protein